MPNISDDLIVVLASATLIFSVLVLALILLFRLRPLSHEDRRPSNAELLLKARIARQVALHTGTGAPARQAPVADPMAERISEIESQLRLLAERQDHSDLRAPGKSPYRLAINLARKGAGAGQIAAHCGLARGEADLIAALHSPARRQETAVRLAGNSPGI